MVGRARGHLRGERGAAAVEFAMLLPILLMLVFGIIQYGFYFWAKQGGSDIARDAARQAAVGSRPDCSDFQSYVKDEIDKLTGSGASAAVTRVYTAADPTVGVQVGDAVTVTVQFTSVDLHIPLVPFIHDGEVSSEAQARVEYLAESSTPEACS